MSEPLAVPGQVIDAWASWTDGEAKSTILRTPHMEVMRLHVNANSRVPTYEAAGEITILCVQGRIVVEALDLRAELNTGQLLYLLLNEPFSLIGEEESSLLITVMRTSSPSVSPTIGGAG